MDEQRDEAVERVERDAHEEGPGMPADAPVTSRTAGAAAPMRGAVGGLLGAGRLKGLGPSVRGPMGASSGSMCAPPSPPVTILCSPGSFETRFWASQG